MKAVCSADRLSCEVFMKLCRVEVIETVCGLLYRSRLAEITWETLSIIGLILSRIRHVRRDVDQSGNRWIRSRFSDYGAAITVSDKNAWSILQSEDALLIAATSSLNDVSGSCTILTL